MKEKLKAQESELSQTNVKEPFYLIQMLMLTTSTE